MLWRNDSAGRYRGDDPANPATALPSGGDHSPVSAAARLKKQRDAARSLA
jgi:hypothetical protein